MQLTSLCQLSLEHQNFVFISLFIHLSITGAHVAPTNVKGCIQPQTALNLTWGCKDRWESVPLEVAVSPHICSTCSSWEGTQKTRIRKVEISSTMCAVGLVEAVLIQLLPLLIYTELSRHLSWAILLCGWAQSRDEYNAFQEPRRELGAGACPPCLRARPPGTQLQPHEGVLPGTGLTQGREVTPQLINTPLVNLLCLCYGYRELMFPPLHGCFEMQVGKNTKYLGLPLYFNC